MAPVGPDSPWEKKLNDRFREMDERKIESRLTSVLCACVGPQGQICTGTCVHHTWQGHHSPR